MRIYEISPGQQKPLTYDDSKFDAIWNKMIVPNCSEILSAYKDTGKYLLRGSNDDPEFFRAMSRNNRKPLDSNENLSAVFDKMLAANGLTALRSNSIFTTTNIGQASSYGRVYMIFPVNGFDFTYTNYSDLIIKSWNDFIPERVNGKIAGSLNKVDPSFKSWGNWLKHLSGGTGADLSDLKDAINKLKYLMPDNPEIQALTFDSLINPENFKERFEPSNTNIEKALNDGVEVYIHGQYYAFSTKRYSTEIYKRLGIPTFGVRK